MSGGVEVITQHGEEVGSLLTLALTPLKQTLQRVHLRALALQLPLQTAHLGTQLWEGKTPEIQNRPSHMHKTLKNPSVILKRPVGSSFPSKTPAPVGRTGPRDANSRESARAKGEKKTKGCVMTCRPTPLPSSLTNTNSHNTVSIATCSLRGIYKEFNVSERT